MVTGGPPFDGDSSQQVVGKHIAEPPPAAADVNPAVPRHVSDVILRCLAKQPAARFQSAAEVIAALEPGQPGTERSRATAAQAATELLVSGARARAAQPTVPVARGSRARDRRAARLAALLGLLLLTLGAGAVWLTQPRLVFENRLAGTVALQVAGEERRLLPGARITLGLARGEPLALAWRLVRPRGGGTPHGVAFGDSVTIPRPRGRVRVSATTRTNGGAYFAPLITNETGRPLAITVNAGLAGALPCGCTVPPGAMRMEIGYYPLFVNSTVRAEDPNGGTATFRDLGREVDAARGVLGLRFRAEDLR